MKITGSLIPTGKKRRSSEIICQMREKAKFPQRRKPRVETTPPTLTIRRWTSSEFAAASRDATTPRPVTLGSIPSIWVAPSQRFTLQFFRAGSFHVQGTRLTSPVRNFDPATTRMTASARGHPDHVLLFLLLGACLARRHGFQIKVQLCCLI